LACLQKFVVVVMFLRRLSPTNWRSISRAFRQIMINDGETQTGATSTAEI